MARRPIAVRMQRPRARLWPTGVGDGVGWAGSLGVRRCTVPTAQPAWRQRRWTERTRLLVVSPTVCRASGTPPCRDALSQVFSHPGAPAPRRPGGPRPAWQRRLHLTPARSTASGGRSSDPPSLRSVPSPCSPPNCSNVSARLQVGEWVMGHGSPGRTHQPGAGRWFTVLHYTVRVGYSLAGVLMPPRTSRLPLRTFPPAGDRPADGTLWCSAEPSSRAPRVPPSWYRGNRCSGRPGRTRGAPARPAAPPKLSARHPASHRRQG